METQWMDEQPYPGPNESSPFRELKDYIEHLTASLGVTYDQINQNIQKVYAAYQPVITAVNEAYQPVITAVKSVEQRNKGHGKVINHGPRSKYTFTHNGKKNY